MRFIDIGQDPFRDPKFPRLKQDEWIDVRTKNCPGRMNTDLRQAEISICWGQENAVSVYARIGKQLAEDLGLDLNDRYCFLFSPNGDRVRLCTTPNGGIKITAIKNAYVFKNGLSAGIKKIFPGATKGTKLIGVDETWATGGKAITWNLFERRK